MEKADLLDKYGCSPGLYVSVEAETESIGTEALFTLRSLYAVFYSLSEVVREGRGAVYRRCYRRLSV